jgi:hypothetical protein
LEPKLKAGAKGKQSPVSTLLLEASSSLRELGAGGDGGDCPQFGDALGSGDLRALAPRCLRAGGEGRRLAAERAGEHQVLHPISHRFVQEVLVELLEQNLRWKEHAHIDFFFLFLMVSNGSISRSCEIPAKYPRSKCALNLVWWHQWLLKESLKHQFSVLSM